ncbi:MAG: pyridoxamine kinase [Clostridia bacterium]
MCDPFRTRVAAIHDISGVGHSALKAVMPVLSAMGIEVNPLPTAVLSSDTNGDAPYSFVDLTDTMAEYIRCWKALGMRFDCIYSGFLGSPRQVRIVEDFIAAFGDSDTLVVVDPVLGDDGEIYRSVAPDMVAEMRRLVARAHMITPNFTEAALLLGEPCRDQITPSALKGWLNRLADLGPEMILITSVPDGEASMAVAALDRGTGKAWKLSSRYIPVSYPGTGDIFTSVVTGGLLTGDRLPLALERAVHFVSQCIQVSCGYDYPQREGVLLERELPLLRQPVQISRCEEL